MDNIQKMRDARIEKQLNKRMRFSEGIMTYKEYFRKYTVSVTWKVLDKLDQYDEWVRQYEAYNQDGSFIIINRLLFEGFKSMNYGCTIKIDGETNDRKQRDGSPKSDGQ